MSKKRGISLFIVGFLILLIAILISTTIGYSTISPAETFQILINKIVRFDLFNSENFPVNSEITILKVRLPRILGAALAGVGLTISGIIYQSILKNPMAEPYVLGVSSGAALGAAISIVTTVTIPFIPLNFITPIFALTGSLISIFLVILISGNNLSTNKVILYGISFNFFLSSLLTLLISFNYKKSSDILFWTLGSFASMNYMKITILFFVVTISSILAFYFKKELNLFTMGLTTAKSLGLNINKYRIILLTIASIVTGVIVSFSGVIGFVGLIIPHLTRLFVGSEHKKVIYLSIPLGAIFMIFCDTLARSLLENELPVGVVTSIIGAPVFVYLLKKRGHL